MNARARSRQNPVLEVPVPPECREMIRRGALVSISTSGGKDSQAMTILLTRVVPAAVAPEDLPVGDQHHRPVDPDAQHVAVRDRGIAPGVAHPGAVAADIRQSAIPIYRLPLIPAPAAGRASPRRCAGPAAARRSG